MNMVAGARRDLLAAGLAVFDRDGFEGATVAAIRTQARASNGSFFHFFGSKKELAGTLFLEVLQRYHAAMLAAIDTSLSAREGIGRLIHAHLDWVVNNRREARYLFEISRSEWTEDLRDARRAITDDAGAIHQPDHWSGADILSRVAVGPRPVRSQALGRHSDRLRHPRAGRTGSRSENWSHVMTADLDVNLDLDFAPIAKRIRESVGRQGFMIHVGAELSELARGSCTLAVDRRPELLQQHGLFHGGVTAFLVDNATTIAAATSRGQPALTAEYKLNLLSPAAGDRLICRARVIKPGRQVAVVAADVFCLIDGVEKHTATALASIAMLTAEASVKIPSPA